MTIIKKIFNPLHGLQPTPVVTRKMNWDFYKTKAAIWIIISLMGKKNLPTDERTSLQTAFSFLVRRNNQFEENWKEKKSHIPQMKIAIGDRKHALFHFPLSLNLIFFSFLDF